MGAKVRYCVGDNGHFCAATYALRTLLEMVVFPDSLTQGSPGVERQKDEVLVTYGGASGATDSVVRIFSSDFFDDYYSKRDGMPHRPVVRIENIPALYRDERESADTFYSVHRCGPGAWAECHVDVVASTFFMLSRYEEIIVQAADVFGRFPAESSVAYQEGFLQEPIVNQYAEQLFRMLCAVGFSGERRRWWGTAPWAVALTHDVDQLYRFPHGRPPVLALARSLLGRAPRSAPRLKGLLNDYVLTVTRRKTDEYNCLEEMGSWELSAGMHAGYYFLGDTATGRHSADYVVDAADAVAKMKMIVSLGHEVGFHAGFSAYSNAERFRCELSKLRSSGLTVTGGRQHYLRWKTPATWRLWETEGLAYDATLGFSRVAGFRCGTCLPFHPYDMENDREMSLWEWPLMFMDATYESTWSEGTIVLDRLSLECQRHGGVLVLLWHNRNWSRLYAPAVQEHFRELLQRYVAQGVTVNSISNLTRVSATTSVSRAQPGVERS